MNVEPLTDAEREHLIALVHALRISAAARLLGVGVGTVDAIVGLSRGRRLRPSTRARIRARLAAAWPAMGGSA